MAVIGTSAFPGNTHGLATGTVHIGHGPRNKLACNPGPVSPLRVCVPIATLDFDEHLFVQALTGLGITADRVCVTCFGADTQLVMAGELRAETAEINAARVAITAAEAAYDAVLRERFPGEVDAHAYYAATRKHPAWFARLGEATARAEAAQKTHDEAVENRRVVADRIQRARRAAENTRYEDLAEQVRTIRDQLHGRA